MSRYLINLSLQEKSNVDLLAQAQSILSRIRSNPNYANPNPSIFEFEALIATFRDALNEWGCVGSRGSHHSKIVVDLKREELEIALTTLSKFCLSKTPNDIEALSSAGFVVKRKTGKITELGAVTHLRQLINFLVGLNDVKLRWSKPPGIGRGVVKTYVIYRSTEADFSTAKLVATVTKTTFTDKGLTERNYFYWVIPISAAGRGVLSNMCSAWVRLPLPK